MDALVALRLGRFISLRRQILIHQTSLEGDVRTSDSSANVSFVRFVEGQKFGPFPVDDLPTTDEEANTRHAFSQTTQLDLSLSEAIAQLNLSDSSPDETHLIPEVDASSESSQAASHASNSLRENIPPIPSRGDGHTFFCPYCSSTQNITSNRRWKKHLLKDLKPYVCTFSGCELQDYFFSNQNEWFSHEAIRHRVLWHCNTASHHYYAEQNDFLDHMLHEHQLNFGTERLSDIAPLFTRPNGSSTTHLSFDVNHNIGGVCNLCFLTTDNLRTHVAGHLQRLALFALPRSNEEANDHSQIVIESHDRMAADVAAELSINQDNSASTSLEHITADFGSELSENVVNGPHIPDIEDPEWGLIFEALSEAGRTRGNDGTRDDPGISQSSPEATRAPVIVSENTWTASKFGEEHVWFCHMCHFGPQTVAITPSCIQCDHIWCLLCKVEEVSFDPIRI